jgi:hypothetical protein
MRSGTIRRMRDIPMRQGAIGAWTRDFRQRPLPAKNCHAALHWATSVTREYQSDSSSKRPASFVFYGLQNRPPPRNEASLSHEYSTAKAIDKGRSISGISI